MQELNADGHSEPALPRRPWTTVSLWFATVALVVGVGSWFLLNVGPVAFVGAAVATVAALGSIAAGIVGLVKHEGSLSVAGLILGCVALLAAIVPFVVFVAVVANMD